MNKIKRIVSKYGYIDILVNQDKCILYAIPNGYISPSLVKKDLIFLADFDENSRNEWKYIVNVSNVKVINPINPFLLRRLKRFTKMKEYIVYVPSPIVRIMLQLTNWINSPDRIIKNNEELELELKQ